MLLQKNSSKSNLVDLLDEQSSNTKYHSAHPRVRVENHGLAVWKAKAQGLSPGEGSTQRSQTGVGMAPNPSFKALHFLLMCI